MKNVKLRIDPMKGVVNPELLIEQLRHLKAGTSDREVNPCSYIKGSLQWLEKHPPNKKIVPLLRLALKKY